MRAFLIAVLILLLVGCAGTPDQPSPTSRVEPPPVKQTPRFDGLAELADASAPERNAIRKQHRYDRSIKPTSLKGLRYYFYEPEDARAIVGFALQNTGSPKINPVGLEKPGARREFAFLFADRARENIHLAINDDVKLSGRFSHDNMFRELHFFPRNELPSARIDHARGLIEVRLPTGELVEFDQATKELVGGVLVESPVDFNRSRHQRRNPQVRYQGDYLAITVAQRGEAPRRAKVWGQTKFAEVHYPARYDKPCKLSPSFIWDQKPKPGDTDPTLRMKYPTDGELFAMIERRCGWNLASLKESAAQVADAGN
jgi:hypothetical protein